MYSIVTVVFAFLDLAVVVGCAFSVLHSIPEEIEIQRWKRVAAWIGYGILAVFLPAAGNDILTTAVLTVYYIGIGRILYYRNKSGLFYQIIFWLVFLLTQYMAAYTTANMIYGLQLEAPLTVCLAVVIRTAFLMTATIVLRILIRKRYVQSEKYLKIRGMILVPVFSMALMFLYVISSDIFLVRYGYGWLLVYAMLLIIINLYCLYFWYDVGKNGELKQSIKLMQQQSELTLQYYQELEENYNHSRKIIHDIRNHLSAIEQAAKMENNSYIEDMHGMLNSLGMKFYTENRMLNIVLNDKLKTFHPANVECRMGGIALDFISDIDITTIFANLLDNAIEAQQEKESQSVKINGEQIHDFLVIKISNPWNGTYVEGKSTKKGHEGLGLQNVRGALEKYNGELQISQKEDIFSVTIAFPVET